MSLKKINILILGLMLLTYTRPLFAQIHLDTSINIAELEKKGFEDRFGTNPTATTNRVAGTVASENFDVNFYRCEWEIDPNVRYIKGKVTSYFTITSATDNITYDLSDTLQVDSIIYHGALVSFQRIPYDGLQIKFPAMFSIGHGDSVAIFYSGVPRSSPSFRAFVQSSHNGIPIIWTVSEPYGAKEWWPCKNAVGDKADSIDIFINSPLEYQASSNGILISESANGSKQSYFKHRYPISSYLVGIAVTNYTVLTDTVAINGNVMNMVDYAYPENADDFNSQRTYTKQALKLYGNLFGPYPFAKEKYGFTQWGAGGGMEHQTNSFIKYPTGELISHESGHQWFGDKVTCGTWQDIWLNEGFATYCQVIYNQAIDTSLYPLILQNMTRDVTSQPGGSVFVIDTTNASRIFNSRLSYEKGAYLLHMLRWKLGDSIFFRGVRRYLNDPLLKYNYARTADLERNLELESGQNLSLFFQKWFYGEGYPSYSVTWMQNKNNWVHLAINQTTSSASVSFYDMPVQLKISGLGRDTLITVNNQQNGETFWVNPGFLADTMFIDPNYWLLAKDRITMKIPASGTYENEIKIYPNPAPDKLNISILNPKGSRINLQLYNITGQLVYKTEKKLSGQDEFLTIPFTQLTGGTYVLRISDNRNMNIKKIVVK